MSDADDHPPASVIDVNGACWTLLKGGLYGRPAEEKCRTLRALHHYVGPLTYRPTRVITTADINRWEENS